MFSTAIQPSVLSLFSSTGTAPLQLFSTSVDPSLPEDSFIHLLHDQKSLPRPAAPGSLISLPSLADCTDDSADNTGYALNQTVLQIQSPTLRTTYIQCPPGPNAHVGDRSHDLAIRHPWMHVQVRNMGREWSLEVGLVDQSGHMGILRLSTFQKQPRLRLSGAFNSFPLLHLPLAFPPSSSRPLTAWCTVTLCLPSYLPYFSSSKLMEQGDQIAGDEFHALNARTARLGSTIPHAVPSGRYSHIAYVRVYATCRLRRIWFDEAGPDHKAPWEFELYGDD